MEGLSLGRRVLVLGAFAAVSAFLPVTASAHDVPHAAHAVKVPPLEGAALTHERRLRAIETAVLGADHAAEHARLRRYERSPYWRVQLRRAARRANSVARRNARLTAADPLDRTGRWTDQFDIPVFAINTIVLPTGKILFFAYPNNPDRPGGPRDEANAYLWDPSQGEGAGSFTRIDPPIDPATGKPVNIWCAGNSLLASGEVLVTGGNLHYPATSPIGKYQGLNHVYTFDPFTETWKQQPDMAHGRWYPSQLLMPDGRTFIMGGLDENGVETEDLEMFTPAAARGGQGTISLVGRTGDPGSGLPPTGNYYPHLFWMPRGHGLVAGPYTNDSWWFQPFGNPAAFHWSEIPNFDQARVWGTAVMVPDETDVSHEVVQLGGSDLPAANAAGSPDALATNTATLFDDDNPGAGWAHKAAGQEFALNEPRSHANTVLLPDATMVEVGGGWGTTDNTTDSGAPGQWAADAIQKNVELWDPTTRKWRLGPAQREYRTYHSTAVLLPDGRLLSAGDDYNGRFPDDRNFTQDSAEIYEPPYLFDGDSLAPRPDLVSAPTSIQPGQGFDIGTDPAKPAAAKAVLMAPGAATHAVDMNQRHVPLEVTGTAAGRLSVKAPASLDVAPPGYYMLFVLDAGGTPSCAAFVRLVAGGAGGGTTSGRCATTSTPPGTTPPGTTPPTNPPPPVTTTTLPRRPKLTAKLVRRSGRLHVRITLGRSSRARVKVRIAMRDRRRHTVRRLTVTLRTGRTTTLNARVPKRVRSIRASVL
jgi:Galactose oxidase-like, Early set domain